MRERHRFDKQGLLALEPSAFLDLFFGAETECAPFELIGDVAVVSIEGPLDHHAGWWCDSYDDIAARMTAALASSAKTVVMRIDSPGGVVSGCFSMIRTIRARAELAGKPIVAHVDGMACSAGYAIASIADKIVCSDTAILGSIGVIQTRVDVTKMDETYGYKFAFITSGSRKADGNPHQAFSDEERVELQNVVDSMANVFFDWTAERRGQDFRPLQAGIAVGADAKSKSLADDVMSFDGLLAGLASGSVDMSKYTDARAALEDAANEEGDESEKAGKVLAYMDSLEGDGEEDTTEENTESAESDEEEKPDASSTSTVAEMAAEIQRLEAELGKSKATTVASFLATRPDLSPTVLKVLKNKPLAEVQAIVAEIKPPQKTAATRSVAVIKPTVRGANQGNGTAAAQAPDAAQALRVRMGLEPAQANVINTPYKMSLSAVPAKVGEGK